jgi:hypothetical protein
MKKEWIASSLTLLAMTVLTTARHFDINDELRPRPESWPSPFAHHAAG